MQSPQTVMEILVVLSVPSRAALTLTLPGNYRMPWCTVSEWESVAELSHFSDLTSAGDFSTAHLLHLPQPVTHESTQKVTGMIGQLAYRGQRSRVALRRRVGCSFLFLNKTVTCALEQGTQPIAQVQLLSCRNLCRKVACIFFFLAM